MSTAWTVLLICNLVYLCLPSGSDGALVISREDEQQESANNPKVIKKRSVNVAEIELQNVKIDCTVTSRFAHTVMTSTALNKANVSQEVFFEVELPKTAFITNFSMEINGMTYVGVVNEKEKAKKQYEAAVSSGKTAGLVKASGRKMEKFSVSVNIAANSNVTFALTFEELLQRRLGKYELMIRVKPKQLVQHFEIVADVYEPQGITFLNAHGTFFTNELLPLVEKTVTDKRAHVSFSPTLDQQRKCPDCDGTLIDGDFFINYDVNREQFSEDIQIVNGYFVHFFAPAHFPNLPKNVVFVIDRSGSMSGTKMQQTHEGLKTILNELHEEDHFGFVTFSDDVATWKPSLTTATKENLKNAEAFVETITASGLTNINDAVLFAVKMLKDAMNNKTVPENSASIIILLTDGNPNAGESNTESIQKNIQNAIGGEMTLFCLGFGYDVSYSFLDVMAKQNNGLARRIYEASDAVLQLQGFYEEVANVLLSDVNFRYPENSVNSLTSSKFKQLFNGSEIVVAGRLNDNTMNDLLFEVTAQSLDNDLVFKGKGIAQDWNTIFPDQEYIFGDFTERLWAYLTIQNLLDKIEKGSPEEKTNATADALELSLKYNFVTPLTSMVVTKPETEKNPEDTFIADKLTEEQRQHVPQAAAGTSLQRTYTSSVTNWVDSDPHFILEFADQNDALCFNINDKPGTIFNLIKDPLMGIIVNGQTIGDKKIDPDNMMNTYFGSFGIVHAKFGIRLVVTTQDILVSEKGKQAKLFWSDNTSIKGSNMDLHVAKDHSLTVTLRKSVKFVIVLHKVWKKHPYHQDFLGFYTLDSHLFSQGVHGLLGQFFHGITFEVSDMFKGEDPDKPDATMFVKGHNLTVTRGWQKDFRKDLKKGENVPCWFVHKNGTGLIDGEIGDYIVSGLFKTI
ncbi:inter-alpha-trypsin inhibitor heavy chain H3-like [Tachysurus vachellii]|uniref:inter-alpha-trypsin inhibitor heavy chain H3-like n=1 Tax=Tachysurus vachellii TaxID=175792 RepID=UPI00296B4C96|nr:inter-alpha-trypsin inhibitor heavy chain H3-like [Tachysurus vachellii]